MRERDLVARCSFAFLFLLSISFQLSPLECATSRLHESDDAPPPPASPDFGATNPDAEESPLSDEEKNANRYLERYGYISPRDLEGRHAPGSALRRFQSFANIPQTGLLDTPTLEMMTKPRCGVSDWNPEDSLFETGIELDFNSRRKRRYALHGTKWNHNDVTWRIDKYTPDLPQAVVDATVAKALNFWGAVSELTFTRKAEGHVDIRIIFQAGRHGDDEGFDGRGGVLAHAYFPFDNRKPLWGDAHFDDAEQWTVRSYRGQNLLYVAVHEFGHSLGISHSKTRGAIMWPWAGEYIPDFRLKEDDINAIQRLYGKPDEVTTTTTSPEVTPSGAPTPTFVPGDDTNCAGSVDAIEVAVDGNVYAFRLALVYKLNNDGVEPGWPKLLSEVFPNGPAYVDACLTVKDWDTTYLFQGKNYWRYSFKNGRFSAHADYPRAITRWGLPAGVQNLDTAFQWGGDDRVYFIKGSRYYSFHVDRRRTDRQGYMSSDWRGLPTYGITAAMKYTNGRTYFYSRNGVYYRWNDDLDGVDTANPTFPRNTGEWWFGCK